MCENQLTSNQTDKSRYICQEILNIIMFKKTVGKIMNVNKWFVDFRSFFWSTFPIPRPKVITDQSNTSDFHKTTVLNSRTPENTVERLQSGVKVPEERNAPAPCR